MEEIKLMFSKWSSCIARGEIEGKAKLGNNSVTQYRLYHGGIITKANQYMILHAANERNRDCAWYSFCEVNSIDGLYLYLTMSTPPVLPT